MKKVIGVIMLIIAVNVFYGFLISVAGLFKTLIVNLSVFGVVVFLYIALCLVTDSKIRFWRD